MPCIFAMSPWLELGLQAEDLLDLRQRDDHGDADREADDDRVGHLRHEPPQPRDAHDDQHDARR